MNKVEIRHKDPKRYGQQIGLPDMGEVTIGKDGIVEVDAELATILVENSPSWEYANPPEAEKEPTKQVEDTSDEDNEGDGDEDAQDDSRNAESDDIDDEDEEEGSEGEIASDFAEKLASHLHDKYSVKQLHKLMDSEGFEKLDSKLSKDKVVAIVVAAYEQFAPKTRAKFAKILA